MGRAVASDSKGPQFKSSLYQVINNEHLLSTVKTNKKEAEKDPPLTYVMAQLVYIYLKKFFQTFPTLLPTPPSRSRLLLRMDLYYLFTSKFLL